MRRTNLVRDGMSGEGGIRTHGGVTPTPVFETGLFNRSSTSPDEADKRLFYVTLSDLRRL